MARLPSSAALLLSLALAHVSYADPASVTSGVMSLRTKNWTVYRSRDQMSDETHCTAIYKADPTIQLTASALYVRVPDPEGVSVRYGANQAVPMRLTTDRERRIDSVVIEEGEFRNLLTFSRLRLRIVSAARTDDRDIDLSGIGPVLKHMADGCAGRPGAK